jgi:hypothetical protein
MKGLDLCRKFFELHGAPMISKEFYDFRYRIAAGMVGEGSECLGFDDWISRDHDWGPGFCLWLNDIDFDAIGKRLQSAYDRLPQVFMGFIRKPGQLSNQKVGVFRISDFYKRFTGLTHAPKTNLQWIRQSDEYLCVCTSGEVFSDPLGRFSKIRQTLLDFYPEDVRMFKIACLCASCARSGQYNFMRCAKRRETFAATYALHDFCSDIMGTVFLLKRRFPPFFKWKHRAIKDLGTLGSAVHDQVNTLMKIREDKDRQIIIENLSLSIIEELKNQGLSHSNSDFLLDHSLSIQSRISDALIRQGGIWRNH